WISKFIEALVRPHVLGKDLEAAYRQMARDEAREAEALEWAEGTVGDVADEARGSLVGKFRAGRRRRRSQGATRRHREQRRLQQALDRGAGGAAQQQRGPPLPQRGPRDCARQEAQGHGRPTHYRKQEPPGQSARESVEGRHARRRAGNQAPTGPSV